MHIPPRLASCLLLALLLAAFTRDAARASEAVEMHIDSPLARTSSPLSLQVKLRRWFPVAVTLSNTGQPLQGRVTLRLTASAGNDEGLRAITVYSDVELPTTARKRVWLYGRSDSEMWDGATVSFEARGLKTLRSSFAIAPGDAGARTIVTISDSGERLAFLNSFTNQRLARQADLDENMPPLRGGGRPGWLTSVGGAHALVPDRAAGLEAADLVVLHDFPHSALAPEQIEAINGYVAAGGALLVAAGPEWQRLRQSRLAELWPVLPEASRPATAGETAELVRRYVAGGSLSGADRLGGSPAILTSGPLRPGTRKLAGVGDTALLAARAWGAGQVIWLAADPAQPPFVGWRGQENLWIEILGLTRLPRRLEYVSTPGWNDLYGTVRPGQTKGPRSTARLVQAIQSLPQLKMPSTAVIAWFLVSYVIVLVPVNYLVLRLIDKREWAWVTVPAIAVVFSVASYLAARNIKGTELLARQVNIVQGSASGGRARSDTMFWMLTPRRADYTVSSSNIGMALSDHYAFQPFNNSGRGGETRIHQPGAGRSFRLEEYNIAMWEEATFVGQGTVELGGGLRLVNRSTLRNDTPFDMRGLVLAVGRRLYTCGSEGTLRRGSSGAVTAVAATGRNASMAARIEQASRLDRLFPQTGENGGDNTLQRLAGAALAAALGPQFNGDQSGAWLIGWAGRPAAAIDLEGEAPRLQNVTLFALCVPEHQLEGLRTEAERQRLVVLRTGERFPSSDDDPAKGRLYDYECVLPQSTPLPRALRVQVNGSLKDDEDYPQEVASRVTKAVSAGTAAWLEVKDAATGAWSRVPGRWTGRAALQETWTFTAMLPGLRVRRLIRRPDNVIQLRVRTAHDTIKASGVTISIAP